MNKAVLILAIFAVCLTPAFSAEERELLGKISGPINLGNIGTIIGGIIGGVKNSTNNTNTSPSTPPANNTNTTVPSNSTNNSTSPSTPPANNTNTTTPTEPSTPPTNNTNTTTPTVPEEPTTPTEPTTPPTNNTNTTVPTTPEEPTTPTEPTTPPVNNNWYARNDVDRAAFKQKCLDIHNILRGAVGVAPVTWSDSLAASAQAWAENMALNGFRHSGRTGENIASTTYSTKVTVRLLGLWTKEQDWYIKGCKYPKCSSNGKEVGHYTQMVWQKTTQVGCGFAPGVNKQWNYLCCQYYRAGNVIGQYVYPYTAPAV